MPTVAKDLTDQLTDTTLCRMRDNPRMARLVHSVWSRLDELERTHPEPGAFAALRYVLLVHQPTRRGTCRACRRAGLVPWRRWRWPCRIWLQVRVELLGHGIAAHGSGTAVTGRPDQWTA